MIVTWIIRVLRWLGWAAFAGSAGLVLVLLLGESIQGPEAGQSWLPDARLWRYFRESMLMAAVATLVSLVLALPVAYALCRVRQPIMRSILLAGTLLPLMTMPGVLAYAWILLSSPPESPAARFLAMLGWFAEGAAPFQSGWVLATWLWPIPALIIAAAFRREGRGAYELARIDAASPIAFMRAAIPAMRVTIMASLAMVFILCALDSTISTLLSTQTWAGEMKATTAIAQPLDRPVAYLFWTAWPMQAVIVAALILVIPGIRRMSDWLEAPEGVGSIQAGSALIQSLPALIVICISVIVPLVTLTVRMGRRGETAVDGFRTALEVYSRQGIGSTLVALATALLATLAALSCLGTAHAATRTGRRLRAGLVVALVLAASLVPQITGTALVSFYASISDPLRWNVYDHTPWVWIAGLLTRFAFLPAVLAWALSSAACETVDQARVEGANEMQALGYIRLPQVWRPLAGAALVVASLSLCEVATSATIQTASFFNGSLSVRVDNEMHYGREKSLIAMTLMLYVPAAMAAVAIPLIGRRSRMR